MVKIGKRKVLQRCGVKLEPKMFTECKRSCVMPTHAQTQRKKYCGHRGRVCTCTCTCILKCMQVQQAKRASMHICACMYACIHAHARAYPNACKYNSGRKRNLDRGLSGIQRPRRRISSTVCAAGSCSTHSTHCLTCPRMSFARADKPCVCVCLLCFVINARACVCFTRVRVFVLFCHQAHTLRIIENANAISENSDSAKRSAKAATAVA